MKRLALILIITVLCFGLSLIALDFFGEHRVFGYETQVDTASARIRNIDYVLFFRRSDTIQTNAVAKIAEVIRPSVTEHWEVAIRRLLLRRKAEEFGSRKVDELDQNYGCILGNCGT